MIGNFKMLELNTKCIYKNRDRKACLFGVFMSWKYCIMQNLLYFHGNKIYSKFIQS